MPYHTSRSSGSRRLRRLGTGLIVIPALLLGMATEATRAAIPCPGQLASLSAARQPACWRPFTADSPINTQLPANPRLAPNNAAVRRHMAAYRWSFQGSSSRFEISGDGSRPVYFAGPSDPVVTVRCTNEEGPHTCQGGNGIVVNGAQIHIPAGARPADNWDAHMIIVEIGTGQEYDFWHASVSGSTLTAGTGAVENVNTSNGINDGGDAASLALTAGLLRPAELASGHINHALAIDIPCTNAHGKNVGYSWPARGGWGDHCGKYWNESPAGAPNIGQLFKLNMTDAQIAASDAPAWEQTVMTALAHYGAYAEDTNGSWHAEQISIFTQDPASWTRLGQPNQWAHTIAALGGHNGALSSSIPIPMNRLVVVDPCAARGLCPTSRITREPHAIIALRQHRKHRLHRQRLSARVRRAQHHSRRHHHSHHRRPVRVSDHRRR